MTSIKNRTKLEDLRNLKVLYNFNLSAYSGLDPSILPLESPGYKKLRENGSE